jgi:sn-glycerol 3-phosphate transport system ATP-binding protein
LSGGQQQRVALARAVISRRPVCLMDEPLSNLDAKLRAEMRSEIRALQRRLGLTMVYVTHDQVEAMTMADRIVLMQEGRVVQAAAPEEIYVRPANTFAARFIGTPPMNLCPASDLGLAGDVLIGLRPEDLLLAASGPGLPVRIAAREYLGADLLVSVIAEGTTILVRMAARHGLPATDAAVLSWRAEDERRFDAATGLPVPNPAEAPDPQRLSAISFPQP